MAIKKGAFELYTLERKLPEKETKQNIKKSHFFDNSYEEKNGSQSVQEKFTSDGLNFSVGATIKPQKNTSKSSKVKTEMNNGSQSVHQLVSSSENGSNAIQPKISFSRLVGIQKEIIIALYKNMRINKSKTTEELTLGMISELAGVNQKSLKNTLFRLTAAGYLSRAEQKNGRGGWVKYSVSEQIIHEIQQKDIFLILKNKQK